MKSMPHRKQPWRQNWLSGFCPESEQAVRWNWARAPDYLRG
jgi:hypothetical protein